MHRFLLHFHDMHQRGLPSSGYHVHYGIYIHQWSFWSLLTSWVEGNLHSLRELGCGWVHGEDVFKLCGPCSYLVNPTGLETRTALRRSIRTSKSLVHWPSSIFFALISRWAFYIVLFGNIGLLTSLLSVVGILMIIVSLTVQENDLAMAGYIPQLFSLCRIVEHHSTWERDLCDFDHCSPP